MKELRETRLLRMQLAPGRPGETPETTVRRKTEPRSAERDSVKSSYPDVCPPVGQKKEEARSQANKTLFLGTAGRSGRGPQYRWAATRQQTDADGTTAARQKQEITEGETKTKTVSREASRKAKLDTQITPRNVCMLPRRCRCTCKETFGAWLVVSCLLGHTKKRRLMLHQSTSLL